jgi:hypothetical protein
MAASAAALQANDAELLEALASQSLSDDGLTHACRLIMRYENTPQRELAERAQALLERWGMDRRRAFTAARRLWFDGFRPAGVSDILSSGSGADSAA